MGFGAVGNGAAEAAAPAPWPSRARASPPSRSALHGRWRNNKGSSLDLREAKRREMGRV